MADLVAWLTQILDEDEAEAGLEKYHEDVWWMNAPFDADFVLADIAAKRARIALHHPVGDGVEHCGVCMLTAPCRTLRLEASAYAARPGYDEEWRP